MTTLSEVPYATSLTTFIGILISLEDFNIKFGLLLISLKKKRKTR